MQEILIVFALLTPCDYIKNVQWFGVTERTLIHRSGIGLRLSVWCNDEMFLSGGRFGQIHWQFRIW